MAATAEIQPKQEYAESTRDLHMWAGRLPVEGEVDLELIRGQEQVNFDNFEKGVAEMTRTAKGFDRVLDLDVNDIEYKMINNQACAADGEPMVKRTARGVEAAKKLADKQPELEVFVVRDEGDEIVAKGVDKLLPGQTLTAISVEPKRELKGRHKKLLTDKGYRDGLIYVQKFSRVGEEVLKVGFYSIDMSQIDVLRDLMFEEYGIEIPADVDPNKFIRYYAVSNETPAEAEAQAKAMRAEHYRRIGVTHKRFSASELVKDNRPIVRTFFDAYYPSLAKAARTGQNQLALKSFAAEIVKANIKDLKPEILQSMIKVSTSQNIDADAVNYINSMLQYATVEEIRKQLPAFVGAKSAATIRHSADRIRTSSSNPDIRINFTNEWLTRNIVAGINAGNAYGGCPAIQLIQKDSSGGLGNGGEYANPQEPFGKACKTIKHGIATNCPHCKQRVTTIVPKEGGEVYCSNSKCAKAAASYLIKSVTGEKKSAPIFQGQTSGSKAYVKFLEKKPASESTKPLARAALSVA